MNYLAQIAHAKRHATHNVALLRSLGYQQIGRGAFSRALVHPDAPDVVIKVGSYRSRHRRLNHLEDAFPSFARRCQRSRSKFYPKIYDIQDDGEHFVVVMKRYRASRSRKIKNQINGTAITLMNGRQTYLGSDMRRFKRALQPLINEGFLLDLHGRNIMQDTDGTPILTDPVAMRA